MTDVRKNAIGIFFVQSVHHFLSTITIESTRFDPNHILRFHFQKDHYFLVLGMYLCGSEFTATDRAQRRNDNVRVIDDRAMDRPLHQSTASEYILYIYSNVIVINR